MTTIPPEININNKNNGAKGSISYYSNGGKSLGRPISFAADIDFMLSNPPQKADRWSRNSYSVSVQVINTICESRGVFFSFKDGKKLQDTQNTKRTAIFCELPLHTLIVKSHI